MAAPRRNEFRLLTTAAKIAAIFIAIVSVFWFTKGGVGDDVVLASEEQVIEAPDQPKRALTALAAPGGIPAGALRR
jgi:hypothetical protein